MSLQSDVAKKHLDLIRRLRADLLADVADQKGPGRAAAIKALLTAQVEDDGFYTIYPQYTVPGSSLQDPSRKGSEK